MKRIRRWQVTNLQVIPAKVENSVFINEIVLKGDTLQGQLSPFYVPSFVNTDKVISKSICSIDKFKTNAL